MSNDSQEFLARSLLFDIETNENGEIYASGASFNGRQKVQYQTRREGCGRQLAELDDFGSNAEYIGLVQTGHDYYHQSRGQGQDMRKG